MRLTLAAAIAALPLAADATPVEAPGLFSAYAEASEARLGYEAAVRTVSVGGYTITAEGGNVCLDTSWRLGDSPGFGVYAGDDCSASDFDGIREPGEALLVTSAEERAPRFRITETAPGWREAGGRDHTPFDGTIDLNGAAQAVTGGWFQAAPGTAWRFGAVEGADYYVDVAPIPLPAAIGFLGAALAWLGGLRIFRQLKPEG